VTRQVQALVVGGGISGLVCAYALKKAGIDVQLVEASARSGGVISSIIRDGFLLELGPQSFSANAAIRQLCADLGIADQLLEAPPRAPRYVLIDGALQPVPLSPPAFFSSLLIDRSTKWALLRDIFGKSLPPEIDESIASFVRRKFSAQLLDRLVGPFASGVYAGDPEKLSLRSAFPQIYEAEKSAGSIVRGMLRPSKSKKGPRERPTLNTFRDGNGTLPLALAKNLGPALLTETRATGVSPGKNGYFIQLQRKEGQDSISANSLILATPTDIAGRLLSQLDSQFEPALAPIEYAAVAVVSLGYRKNDVCRSLDGFGFLVPRSSGLRVLGTVWNSLLFPGRATEGNVLLTSFVGGTTDPSAATLPPQELARLVHREISTILSIRQEPAFSNVAIWPRALPQCNLGHGERLAQLAALQARYPGIWFVGNYLRGPAIGSCVEHALAVANNVQTSLAE